MIRRRWMKTMIEAVGREPEAVTPATRNAGQPHFPEFKRRRGCRSQLPVLAPRMDQFREMDW